MRTTIGSAAAATLRFPSLLHGPKPCGGSVAGLRVFDVTPSCRSIATINKRPWSTPLAKQLSKAISTTGPVPLASYMRMCLTGDVGGYYSGALGRDRNPFGADGDFVTSPEISQIFGELVGLWFVAEWISQGRPRHGVQLIELGPGRGTLMDDMLRTIQRFPEMASVIESVFMVEACRELRETQKNLLCGPGSPSVESNVGYHSTGKRLGKPIVWTETINSIPIEPDKVPFIVSHEFFDALPIHTFQSALVWRSSRLSATPRGANEAAQTAMPIAPVAEWREMMVSVTDPSAMGTDISPSYATFHEPPAEFRLVLSSGTTRHSRYLPDSSPRYRELKHKPGSVIEICPDASMFAADFASRIGGSRKHPKASPRGAALILDYGTADTIPINSLRGIRNHRRVNPFASPGFVDLSADVDFTAIAESALLASNGVEVHGPVLQADFLELMGIRERAKALTGELPDETARQVQKSWKCLIDRGPNGIGKVYKALAILPENDGRRRPVGFGGDVRLRDSGQVSCKMNQTSDLLHATDQAQLDAAMASRKSCYQRCFLD